MPRIVGPDCVDTVSTDALCLYPAKALGGNPTQSPNVKIEGEEVKYYQTASVPDPTDPQPLPTNTVPLPCQPGTRRMQPTINTTVYINGNLFVVQGDEAQLVAGNTPRPLVGPFKYPTVLIQEGGAAVPPDDGTDTPPPTNTNDDLLEDDGGTFEFF